MTLGLKYLGDRLVGRLRADLPHSLITAAGFILVTAMVAAVVHLLALAGRANLWLLRVLAWSLLSLGILELYSFRQDCLQRHWRRLVALWQEQSMWSQATVILMGLTALGFWLSSLGPPTDADSLDYHLGVPLEILRWGGALPRPDWLHAQLVGLGESLNMLGLAGGTDIWGASLQFAGLVVAVVAISSLGTTTDDKMLASIGVLACPVVAFLVPNQKPMMLPVAATTIAMILLSLRFRTMDLPTLTLAWGCAFFAMACKYSFLFSGVVVLGAGLIAAQRSRMLGRAVGVVLGAYLVLLFPVHLQNLLFYGDPISPFLERYKSGGDRLVVAFAEMLRAYSDFGGGFFPFPVNLLLPQSIGSLTTVLGLGPLLLWVGLQGSKNPGAPRILISGALLVCASTLALGQVTARFFFEPYLWVVAAAIPVAWTPYKRIGFRILTGQLLVVAMIAIFGAAILFPGAWTGSLRDMVMTRYAYGYAETRWLDRVLPPDAVVATQFNCMALMPRPSFNGTILDYANMDDPRVRHRMMALLQASHVNAWVDGWPISEKIMKLIGPERLVPLAGPRQFNLAVRNPWNQVPEMVMVYGVNLAPGGSENPINRKLDGVNRSLKMQELQRRGVPMVKHPAKSLGRP